MKILVIIGECLRVNSSANLCHLAYLKGLVDAHHDVTLVCGDAGGYEFDPEMKIPDGIICHEYHCISLYERLGTGKKKKKSDQLNNGKTIETRNQIPSGVGNRRKKHKLKEWVRSLYGPYGIYSKFVKKAIRFRAKDPYDIVVSISTPASSHLLAYKLIRSGHVACRHWVQIWEDPWYGDVFCTKNKERIFREESRLLAYADRVCYVSPITLVNQKQLYPDAALKMFWAPLPAYYEGANGKENANELEVFGYFGEYRMPARNLAPFYQAAKKTGLEVNICGNSNLHLASTEKIHVYPRLELTDLRQIEEKTGVLVFLCNCRGGQIPGKIYQYAATDKTILFILDGTEEEKQILKKYFEPFNRFVFCENNQEDIERAIQSIQKGEIGNVVNKPLTQFSPASIVSQILEESMREIQ